MSTPVPDPYADDPQPANQRDPTPAANPFVVPAPPPDPGAANPFSRTVGPPLPAVPPTLEPPSPAAPPGSGAPVVVPSQPNPNGGGVPRFPISVPSMEPEPQPVATTSPRMMTEPAPLPIPGHGGARAGQPVRIGLWASSRAGKSTFMASLPLAAMQGRHGTWLVAGTDDLAAEALNRSVSRLVVERRFPTANMVIEGFSWTFHGTPPPSGFGSLLRSMGLRKQPSVVEFTLEVFDPPGGLYRTSNVNPEALDHLANANGLLYLIDPDPQLGDASFQSFYGTLQMLTGRMASTGQLVNGRLPHAIAVCVTKFDDETFFRRLVTQTGLVSQDADGHRLPRVPQEQSHEFFDWVCARVLGGSAEMVREGLNAYFLPDRIQYFATSAIGFRLNQNQVFDFRDFRNVHQVGQDTLIRDRPRPINVLEPLIYLEQRIRAGLR